MRETCSNRHSGWERAVAVLALQPRVLALDLPAVQEQRVLPHADEHVHRVEERQREMRGVHHAVHLAVRPDEGRPGAHHERSHVHERQHRLACRVSRSRGPRVAGASSTGGGADGQTRVRRSGTPHYYLSSETDDFGQSRKKRSRTAGFERAGQTPLNSNRKSVGLLSTPIFLQIFPERFRKSCLVSPRKRRG